MGLYRKQRILEERIGLRPAERAFVMTYRQHPVVRVFYNCYRRTLTSDEGMSELMEALRNLRRTMG